MGEWSGFCCGTDQPSTARINYCHFPLPSIDAEYNKGMEEMAWESTSWVPHFNAPEIRKWCVIATVLDPGNIQLLIRF